VTQSTETFDFAAKECPPREQFLSTNLRQILVYRGSFNPFFVPKTPYLPRTFRFLEDFAIKIELMLCTIVV
jgi:hypothetical protein